jgi:hypothetical protein
MLYTRANSPTGGGLRADFVLALGPSAYHDRARLEYNRLESDMLSALDCDTAPARSTTGDHVQSANAAQGAWGSPGSHTSSERPQVGGWRSRHMEPVIVSSNAQLSLTATDQSENTLTTTDSAEASSESFVATIVRLDQSSAEQLFRAAKL